MWSKVWLARTQMLDLKGCRNCDEESITRTISHSLVQPLTTCFCLAVTGGRFLQWHGGVQKVHLAVSVLDRIVGLLPGVGLCCQQSYSSILNCCWIPLSWDVLLPLLFRQRLCHPGCAELEAGWSEQFCTAFQGEISGFKPCKCVHRVLLSWRLYLLLEVSKLSFPVSLWCPHKKTSQDYAAGCAQPAFCPPGQQGL